jgi:hypothetical protein
MFLYITHGLRGLYSVKPKIDSIVEAQQIDEFCSPPSTNHSHPAAIPFLPLRKLSHDAHLNLRKVHFMRDLTCVAQVNLRGVS